MANQMLEVAAEAVQLPEHERVAGLQCSEAGIQAQTRVTPTRGEILVDALAIHAGLEHRIVLRASV